MEKEEEVDRRRGGKTISKSSGSCEVICCVPTTLQGYEKD